MEEKFIIPIDGAIHDFYHHLDTHDRTILSARFGDGKSFFLSHFMEDEKVKERYTFLTIFPVNYQVTENRDIFEIIKRDIIIQMLLKGVIETEVEIYDEVALALYLQCHPLGFFESFLPLLSELALNEDAARAVAVALAGKKFFKSIKQKIIKIKEKSRDSRLDAFLNAVEKNPVVGQDAISSIIQQCLQQYREKHPNKRVVLIIEDLDRIDPAHLFRILNIFSAHIDFYYRIGRQPDKTLAGNKFGLDKVVFVMHYENVKYIYEHFYGSQTNFEGYIEKFCSSNHFNYSFQEEKSNYFRQQIGVETELPTDVLDILLMPEDFKDLSVRSFAQAIENIDNSILIVPSVKNNNNIMVSFHPGILRLIVILRKFKKKDNEILDRMVNAIMREDSHRTSLFSYLAHYLTSLKLKNVFTSIVYSTSTSLQRTYRVQVDDIDKSGKASCSFSYTENGSSNAASNIRKLLVKLLKMVAA